MTLYLPKKIIISLKINIPENWFQTCNGIVVESSTLP